MSEAAAPGPAYAELACASNFSFLRGASHGSDLVGQAIKLGHKGLGIADRNTVAGVVRAWKALKEIGERAEVAGSPFADFKLATGARLVFADGTPDVIAYPATRHGWGRLCRLLTEGNMRAQKGSCILSIDDLIAFADDLLLIVLPTSSADPAEQVPHGKPIALPGDAVEAIATNVLPFPSPHKTPFVPSVVEGWAPGGAPCLTSLDYARDERMGDSPPKIATIHPLPTPVPRRDLIATLARLKAIAPDRVWLGVAMPRKGPDRRRLARFARIATAAGVPPIAINDVLYATPEERPLQDVLTCIREGTTIQSAGLRLEANAERHLKDATEMARLFGDAPEAIAETTRLLARIDFDLRQISYEYPHEPVPEGWHPQKWLQHLVIAAARRKWPDGTSAKVRKLLREEFRLIRVEGYAYYFLTVHDVVKFARDQTPPILCQGRGSAANSMVCYLLGVTSVDPAAHDLLFSRFLSTDRKEPPDIDVDFEHERREEVMQYIYRRYGRHRAGIVSTVIHFRSRSAVREVGKALGLTEDVTTRLTSTVWGSYSTKMEESRFKETGFDLDNPEIARLNHFVAQLLTGPDADTDEPVAFPRHLSQHVGGFVLTEGRLDETVPLHHAAMDDRTFIEWDKDDIDALKLMKVDVLALGMLTCIRKAFVLMRESGGPEYLLETVPSEQPDVYDMLCKGDSIGVFQVESRAQMNMLPRLKPRVLYDLVVQVAIVRPGPIQGDMVHPYLRRREGTEPTEYPSPGPPHPPNELEELLGNTFGVPLFQEQAMKLAIVAAGFSGADANRFRRAMATFRNVGTMPQFETKLVEGMVGRGYARDFAERCYQQIKGFGSYGFPESHAQSFARLVYVSSLLKCRHPAAFCAAILNSQPMGFYAPAQLVRDAIEHGVEVRRIDVLASGWDNGLEPADPLRGDPPREGLESGWDGPAVRLGFRQIDGFREDWAKVIGEIVSGAPAPNRHPSESWGLPPQALRPVGKDPSFRWGDEKGGWGDDRKGGDTLVQRLAHALPARALRLLADADAFRSIGLDRRQALWEVRRQPDTPLPLFAAAEARELGDEADARLPAMPLSEQVAADYQMTRMSLKEHPMTFLRDLFRSEGVRSCREIGTVKDGRRARVAGVVLVRQRPGKGNAIFVTLEDETGVTNLVMWARVFEQFRRDVMASRLILAEGVVQNSKEGIVHLMVDRVEDRTAELGRLSSDHPTRVTLSRADEFEHPQHPRYKVHRGSHPREVRILPPSRDFH
ncbi:error-prone DNA polymerase [Sphingomonas naphthae]|uniref:Error-prone DNA polymerase n=1 Tax=Sphingomonas naphthae TaxID=1813468 RepID=A0ABY7TPV1_9SPHN|nr:error-prone DNA polymerase [Sphingomonas naphthae]WCT75148.1 error-prone DNA polymerase [Sphingomonas naphthae]